MKQENGFAITQHKGVRVTFANGWAISVQWGPGNYVSDRTVDWDAPKKSDYFHSVDAEIAMFTPEGNWYRPEGEDWGDDVKGHVSPDEVLRYMSLIAAKPGAVESSK